MRQKVFYKTTSPLTFIYPSPEFVNSFTLINKFSPQHKTYRLQDTLPRVLPLYKHRERGENSSSIILSFNFSTKIDPLLFTLPFSDFYWT